jgi:hypothetical protein
MTMQDRSPAGRTRNARYRAVWLEVSLWGLKHAERDARFGPLVHAGLCSMQKLSVEPHVRVTVKGNDGHR